VQKLIINEQSRSELNFSLNENAGKRLFQRDLVYHIDLNFCFRNGGPTLSGGIFKDGAPKGTGERRNTEESAGWHTQANILFNFLCQGIHSLFMPF